MEKTYRPEFARRFGKTLSIQGNWDENEVNAHATRDLEDNAIVNVPGGLARHSLLTEDGFVLVICHELGHFLGGYPKMLKADKKTSGWSSAEGQADYFASSKCFKTLLVQELLDKGVMKGNEVDFDRELEEGDFELKSDTTSSGPTSNTGLFSLKDVSDVEALCTRSACKRLAYAALSAAKVFAAAKWDLNAPSLDKHDPRTVQEINFQHTSSQCRLDTFVAGWFCPKSLKGDFDDKNPGTGACLEEGDASESPYKRPACWFAQGS